VLEKVVWAVLRLLKISIVKCKPIAKNIEFFKLLSKYRKRYSHL